MPLCARELSGAEGNLLRRRYLQLTECKNDRHLRQTEEAKLHLYMSFSSDDRLRYLQLPEGKNARTLRQTEAAQLHLELHFSSYDRLRNPESHEGRRMPAPHCVL